ncbi:MAG: ABC transporter substrate-binding protein [Deltaproteobacteria bacterium]|nr:ABC transporter substrate-binding protein [Deltaproteobacteria bacterium]
MIADYGGTSGFQSPIWAAREGGFFAKYGLDIDIVMIPGGTQSMQALISGGTQFSQSSAAAPIHSRLGGSDVVIVATSINKYPFSVVARPGIKTPADLVGKKLGVVRLGGSNELALRKALSLWGIDPRSVTFLQMGEAASRLIALDSGNLDATVLAPPHTLKARKLKMTILADLNALPIYYPQSSIAVKESTLGRQPNLVKNFLKAYIEGIHMLRTNKAESLKILARYMRTGEKEIIEETYDYFSRMVSPIPRTNLEGIQEILSQEAQRLPNASRWKPAELVRESILDELEKEGFTQKFR